MSAARSRLRSVGDAWHIQGPALVQGTLQAPADKSLMHRGLLLAALSSGHCRVHGSPGEDVLRTAQVLQQLGVPVRRHQDTFAIDGRGHSGFSSSAQALDCGNSGTTMRLLAGVLAAQPFRSTLVGDASLMQRPMQRLVDPLQRMGAQVETRGAAGRPPLVVGRHPQQPLRGTDQTLKVDSAQVRSAVLLAGLQAHGPTRVRPASAARDHTQRMLRCLGVAVTDDAHGTLLHPTAAGRGLAPFDFAVPGDVSSVAFFVASACATPGSRLQIDACGLNPGRTRYLEVLQRAGARIDLEAGSSALGEPAGRIRVRGGRLSDIDIGGDDLVACIDEVPALAAAAAIAGCGLRVRDARELRFKESDRIAGVAAVLRAFGGDVREQTSGLRLQAGTVLQAGVASSRGDHRLAMAAAVLAACSPGRSTVEDVSCVATSYPAFARHLADLLATPPS